MVKDLQYLRSQSHTSDSGLYNELGGIGIDGFWRRECEHGPVSNLKLAQILQQIITPVNISTKSSSLSSSALGLYMSLEELELTDSGDLNMICVFRYGI